MSGLLRMFSPLSAYKIFNTEELIKAPEDCLPLGMVCANQLVIVNT
jgi:hypothetical protein